MDKHETNRRASVLLERVSAMVKDAVDRSITNPNYFSAEFRHVVAASLHAGASEEDVLSESRASRASLSIWKRKYSAEAKALIEQIPESAETRDEFFRKLPLIHSEASVDLSQRNCLRSDRPEYILVLPNSVTIRTVAGGLTAELVNFVSQVRCL